MQHQNPTISISYLKEQLEQRQNELQKALTHIRQAHAIEPDGKLRIAMTKGTPQYYRIIDAKDTVGGYIRKENQELISLLAQKGYHAKTEKNIKKELHEIEKLISLWRKPVENIYDELNAARKDLVSPLLVSDEIFEARWLAEQYESDPYYPENKIYETKRGEMVRSKSEMMIADAYYELDIPYRYEAKLTLQGGLYKFPDFTVLHKKTREIIYHEHFGLLNQEEYRLKALQKIEVYQKAGIYLGKNLIITYETEETPFNIRQIKKMFKKVFQ